MNITGSARFRASSLKTDVCLMVHDNEGCNWRENNSIRIPAGDHPDLSLFQHSRINFDNRIASYKLCADDAWGGSDIHNVEFSGPSAPEQPWSTMQLYWLQYLKSMSS